MLQTFDVNSDIPDGFKNNFNHVHNNMTITCKSHMEANTYKYQLLYYLFNNETYELSIIKTLALLNNLQFLSKIFQELEVRNIISYSG